MNTNIIIGGVASVVIIIGILYLGFFNKAEVTSLPYENESLESADTLNLSEQPATITMPTNENIVPITQDVSVTLKTNKGDIMLTLHGANAPITVGNFVQLAESNFYDGTAFHRIIPDFMIQGGDPFSKDPTNEALVGTGDAGYKFQDEINDQKLVRGSVAMANSGPNTNGSQFFIVTTETTPWLDGLHTNFGEVTSGMEVVDAISAVQTDQSGRPAEPIVIQDVIVQR